MRFLPSLPLQPFVLGALLLTGCTEAIDFDPGLGPDGPVAEGEGELPPAEGEGELPPAEGEGELPPAEGEGEPGEGEGEPPVQLECPRVAVHDIGADPLNVRPGPNRSGTPVGTLRSGEIVDVLDRVDGEAIDGQTTWYEIARDSMTGFVSASFVDCTTQEPPPPPPPNTDPGFMAPFACNASVRVTQGNNTNVSHNGMQRFAYDFGIPSNTELHAAEDGTVSLVSDDVNPGDPCYNGGGSGCANSVNYVLIDHSDGTSTLYLHLNDPLVEPGEVIRRGDIIGLSGTTGWSTGPHLHIQRQQTCGSWWCQSVEMDFADIGIPSGGQTVTSGNCQ